LAWTRAKRFCDDHPKGAFKPEGLHFSLNAMTCIGA
jgi:hypothetical protein